MTKFFTLCSQEAKSTVRALNVLHPLPWARELRREIKRRGGINTANMSFLFEARVARALHDCGIVPEYEHPTGVGYTSVDFHFDNWFVELLSLNETDAAKAATWESECFDGVTIFGRELSTPRPPTEDESVLDNIERDRRKSLRRQSKEMETYKVISRIIKKAGTKYGPAKFPLPYHNYRSVLIVDLRSFGSVDREDCRQIAHGHKAVPEWARYWCMADDGEIRPILGAFEEANTAEGADHFRRRVHYLGLVAEEKYESDELQYFIRFYHNPHLFSSKFEARLMLSSFPLFQPSKTRARRPDLFLHELLAQDKDTIQFGIVSSGATVKCKVHRDTLEDLEKCTVAENSIDMWRAFNKHKDLLERLASVMITRKVSNKGGIVFICPNDLKLIKN